MTAVTHLSTVTSPDPAMKPAATLSLGEMPEGSVAVIATLVAERCAVGVKLQALGFVADTPLSVLRRAPFGGPMIVVVRGAKVALRRSEANLVQVRIVDIGAECSGSENAGQVDILH
jgi:ferrous iron transport protein A